MKVTLNGLNTLQPEVYAFIRSGFLAGRDEGAWPDWRNSPTEEEMVYIASDESGPIGFATFYHTDVTERVWLDLLWVAPEHRRKSAGTRLLAAVLAYGERHGLAVEFGVIHDNEPMLILTRSFGIDQLTVGFRKEPVGMKAGA